MTRLLTVLAAAFLVCVSGRVAAQGAGEAGRFINVTGEVKILGGDGATRTAVRNGEIRQGDSIVTGANSLAQLRMSDGGAVSVRADTQLKLDTYRFAGADDRESSFAVSIIKGGFRAITGLIARNSRENFRINTSTMTIGVRGTHFEVVHVLKPISDALAGTYNRVYDGSIVVRNRAGASLVVNPGQTVFVALPANLAPVLVKPPSGVFGKPTPAPQPLPPQSRRDDGQGERALPAVPAVTREATEVREISPVQTVAPARIQTAPMLNPIDTPRVMETAPTLQTLPATKIQQITPTTTFQVAPALTPIDKGSVSPTLTAPATAIISPAAISPTPATATIMTPITPIVTTPAPATAIMQPITPIVTQPAPTMTIMQPVTPIVIQPAQTMTIMTPVAPVITAPTTTISPILTAPATTFQAPIIKK